MTSSRRRPIRALPIVALAVPALLLAGCASTTAAPSNVSGASGSGTEASTIAAASSKASAEAAGRSGSTGTGLCALVSLSDVQAAVPVTPALTRQVADTGLDGEPVCGLTSEDASTYLLRVDEAELSKQPFAMKGNFDGKPLTAVSGVGEKAGVNDGEFDVQVHGKLLSVETAGTKDVSRDQLIALARLFVDAL